MPPAPKVEPYRERVKQRVDENVEMATIFERLKESGYCGSYWAVRRFVHTFQPPAAKATVRVERKPGEEAQVDFGYAGRMIDPRRKSPWSASSRSKKLT